MKYLIFVAACVLSLQLWGQRETTLNSTSEKDHLSFAMVEKVPLTLDCVAHENSPVEEQQACFNESVVKFVSSNYNYPIKARSSGLTAKIFVNFIVETDGSISNVEILKGAASKYKNGSKKVRERAQLMDDEAVRVVKLIKIAAPGRQRGTPVRVQYAMPINLTLS